MKKYEVKGGGLIEASTDFELVEVLRNESHTPSQSLNEFMREMSRRCRIQNGAVIRTNNPIVFIEDLKAAKYLIPME